MAKLRNIDRADMLKLACVGAAIPMWGVWSVVRDGGSVYWHDSGWWQNVLFVCGCMWAVVESFGTAYIMECAASLSGRKAKILYGMLLGLVLCLLLSMGGTMWQFMRHQPVAGWHPVAAFGWVIATALLPLLMPGAIATAKEFRHVSAVEATVHSETLAKIEQIEQQTARLVAGHEQRLVECAKQVAGLSEQWQVVSAMPQIQAPQLAHQCKKCERSFATGGALNAHMKSHKGE